MPGQLHPLPRAQIGEYLTPGFLDLLFDQFAFLLKTDVQGVFFGMLLQVLQLGLQFEDRFLEIKLVFHAEDILSAGKGEATRNSSPESGEPDLRPALLSDEVFTPSLRRSEGQCGQLWRALFAPHCEQNLSANPKRTAKS
jgi:hypothetical protein